MPDDEIITWLDCKDLSVTMCLNMHWKILASHKGIQEMLFFDKVFIDYKEELKWLMYIISVNTKHAINFNKFLASNL